MQRGPDVTDRITGADGVNPYSQDPDLARVLAWCRVHSRDIDEAPFWRAYRDNPGQSARRQLLARYVCLGPDDPIWPKFDPNRLRAAVVVAFLRGQFHAPDLDPVENPWPWSDVCDYSTTQRIGFKTLHSPETASATLAMMRARGHLDIPEAPPEVRDSLDRLLTAWDGSNQVASFGYFTGHPTPGDHGTAGRTRDGGGR